MLDFQLENLKYIEKLDDEISYDCYKQEIENCSIKKICFEKEFKFYHYIKRTHQIRKIIFHYLINY